VFATFTVDVGVALSRPPKRDDSIYCIVAVDMSNKTQERVENEARLIACQMAATQPRVAMPVSAEIIAVDYETTEAEVGEGNGERA
jgi:hypothetical protein